MIKKITKRDQSKADFNPEKIRMAAEKAFIADGMNAEESYNASQRISDKVVTKLEMIFNNSSYPTVEQTQNFVEGAMKELGYDSTQKRYSVYRKRHKKFREMNSSEQAIFEFSNTLVKRFVAGEDLKSDENANQGGKTFQGLNARLAGTILNLYALNEMYGKQNKKIKNLHKDGSIHIHDLDFPIVAYCCGHSLEQLLERGFGEVRERIQSYPAKHLETIVAQMINYIGTIQGEFAGAQAFSSVDTFLAPFVRADNLDQKRVNQYMQMLIYGLNVASRWGWQAPFSNLTFDLTVPEDLENKKALVGGKRLDSTYGEYQKEMTMINKGFLETMLKGDKSGRIFTFPIPTYNLTPDFDWDSSVSKKLFEVTGKYGIPYFQNYIGSGLDPKSIRAMCCRLNIDQTELINRPGGMWGPGDATGSIGVVTINMNRIGYEAENEKEFLEILKERMDVASESLEIKRAVVKKNLEQDFMPYTKSYLGHFENHFSTIGLCGMNEACINFLKKDISSPKGKDFAERILEFMRSKVLEYQKETSNLYNLEATPAESTSYRFARLDKQTYPKIHTSGINEPFLTNSTQLPVDAEKDLFSALKHQESLQALYTGGTIFHTFLGESIDGEAAKNLVRKIATETTLPYFSITPVFSVCQSHGYITGKVETCPDCGEITEIYDRIVGYLRPVKTWNKGKQEEFLHRKRFS